jgi:anti-anti-sigma factor
MAISSSIQEDGSNKLITVTESFDATCYIDFKAAFEPIAGAITYVVDMSGIKFMDSSGLGLLIMLREHAARTDSTIVLKQPSPIALKNLEKSFFHEIFDIV